HEPLTCGFADAVGRCRDLFSGLLVDLHPVGVQRRDHRLEEGGSSGRAVAAAAGGQAEGKGAVVQRAAAVAGLGAHGGLDQAANGAAAEVVHGDVERGDGAGVGAGGAAGTGDRLTDDGVGRGGNVVVARHGARVVGVRGVVPDQRVVLAGEGGGDRAAEQRAVVGRGPPGGLRLAAVAGGQEVVGAAADHVEA